MSGGRRSDGLLSADATLHLLELASPGPQRPDTLAKSLQAVRGASLTRCHNTIDVLKELGIFAFDADQVALLDLAAASAEWRSILRTRLLNHYQGLLQLENVGTAFQLHDSPSDLRVDSLQLPFRERGYPYLLLEFGIASREAMTERFWRIAADAADVFLERIRILNESSPTDRKFSLADLIRLQQMQADAGKRAEDWVVAYERERLIAHPFRETIRAISEENAAAGFDIVSFENPQALVHDRFIEVKSYGEEYGFYWSPEEIEEARIRGARYWLYLVDRKLLAEPGYQPEMIPDPFSFFLTRRPASWQVVQTGMKFVGTVL